MKTAVVHFNQCSMSGRHSNGKGKGDIACGGMYTREEGRERNTCSEGGGGGKQQDLGNKSYFFQSCH